VDREHRARGLPTKGLAGDGSRPPARSRATALVGGERSVSRRGSGERAPSGRAARRAGAGDRRIGCACVAPGMPLSSHAARAWSQADKRGSPERGFLKAAEGARTLDLLHGRRAPFAGKTSDFQPFPALRDEPKPAPNVRNLRAFLGDFGSTAVREPRLPTEWTRVPGAPAFRPSMDLAWRSPQRCPGRARSRPWSRSYSDGGYDSGTRGHGLITQLPWPSRHSRRAYLRGVPGRGCGSRLRAAVGRKPGSRPRSMLIRARYRRISESSI
jgi:hypothetical protein